MNGTNTPAGTRKPFDHLARLALVTSLAFAMPAQAETRAGAFEMLVFEDSVEGRHLIEGNLDKALALNETRNESRFSALNDRCVALTLARELDKAGVVCNDAVRAARRSDAARAPGTTNRMTGTNTWVQRAMAFTNRGVVHALQGEPELARNDFRAAIKLSTRVTAATGNLDVLEDRLDVASID